MSALLPLAPLLLKEGGSSSNKLASGGVAKIRRGMMTKDGKVIDAPVRSPISGIRK